MNYYYENSDGRIINLNEPPFYGVKSNSLFSFKWNYITQGQSVQKIVKFEKRMVEKNFQVVISGLDEKRYLGNLELFLQLTDVDINNLKMGKLWMDDYYLEGYIFASSKAKRYLGTDKTVVDLTVVCENGNWQSEETWKFRRDITETEDPQYTGYGIIYPYAYNYDYSAPFGKNTIINESYLDTDFEITFYGANEHPMITIGGQVYDIKYDLGPDDYLKINSKTKTAIVYKRDGSQGNVFYCRNTNYNLFEKIKRGGNLVIRPKDSVIDVKLFYERSEPKYTEAKWT